MGGILRWLRAGLYGLAALWAALTFGFGPVKENPGIMTLAALTPLFIVHGLLWVISAVNNGAKSVASGHAMRRKVHRPTTRQSSQSGADLETARDIYRASPLDKVQDLVTRIAAAYGVDRAKAYRILSKVRKESGHLDFQAENSAASPGEPPVDELLQVSTNDDGQTVVTRVRPITAALMSFVKRKLDLPDTIDISPDEMHATWIEEFSVHAADSSPGDDDRSLLVKIETFEDRHLLTLTVLIDEVSLLGKDKAALERLVAEANGSLPQGCYHLLDGTGETPEHHDGHSGSHGSKISNMCRVLFDATLPPEQNTADTLGGQPAPVIKPAMIATLFEAGLAAANAMRDQLRRSGWGRENHSDESPGMLIERAEFRAVVAAAKAIANARQDETLTPGLLLAGVLRASQEAGPERAAIRAALGVDGLGQAFDSLRTLSLDPSNASEPAKDAKMPLSAELQKLLKDHKRSGMAEFVAQLLIAVQR